MFIIKQTDTNIVLDSSDTIEYQPNNYPVVRPGTAYALAYYPNGIEVVEVESIPEDFVPKKYLYTDNSFVLNPEYTEPNKYGISDELLEQIKNDTITEVQQEVNTNAD